VRNLFLALACASLATTALSSSAGASPSIETLKPTKIQLAAVADKTRPAADVKRDEERKPADMLAFAGVHPGERIADFIPGGGYFTRLFASAVGPKGVIYAFTPAEFGKFSKTPLPASGAHPDPDRPNIVSLTAPANAFSAPEPLDLVWTSQNYHDLKYDFAAPADTALVNKAVYAALKPGGLYVILDHVGLPDKWDPALKLHRIDPAVVKKEVEAAGFVFDGSTEALRNPYDPHDKNVYDKSIRGHTDQFVYRFHKPAHAGRKPKA
jgi:predicted methyltransferase